MSWRIPDLADSGGFTEEPWYDEPPRARRIRDKQRMKARARRIFKQIADHYPVGLRQAYMKANERLADNLAHCGKPCCNKRRLHEGPTQQEIKFFQEPLDDD